MPPTNHLRSGLLYCLCTFFYFFSTPSFPYGADIESEDCRPPVNINLPQYVIGYGSLMQEESKRESDSKSGEGVPIYITGFKRGWMELGTNIGFTTVYLGVKPDAKSRINAIYFKLDQPESIKNYDKREDTYCRVKVLPEKIDFLTISPPEKGQFWIYTHNKDEKESLPTLDHPLVQSYVDIFLSGCFQLEEKFKLQGFAKDCIKTTAYWSDAWVNDRIYPRKAFDKTPYAAKIDTLILSEMPQHFKAIRIE